jgi:hypothetical protein
MNLKKIILIINISLAILIGWTCYLGFRTWQSNTHIQTPLPGTKETSLVPKNTASSISQKGPESFQDVINTDPFGTKKAESQAPIDVSIPTINLNDFELKGTIVGENADSFAIILHRASREQKLYYLRDRIQGATIAQIKADQVTFDLGSGHMENLFMMLVKDSSLRPGFETFPKSVPLPPAVMPPLPKTITPQGISDMNPPVIKNLRPKPIELKKRPLS